MKKKRDDDMRMRKWLGVPVGYPLRSILEGLELGYRKVEQYMAEPERAKREFERKRQEFVEKYADERTEATWKAVEKGRRLEELRGLNGPAGWSAVLVGLGLCRRTFENLRSLFLLAQARLDLLKKFACLGPTKLYRLARRPFEELEAIDLDEVVEIAGKRAKLRNMTDRELILWLRKRFPGARGPSSRRLRERAAELAQALAKVKAKAVTKDLLDDVAESLEIALRCVQRMLKRAA